VYLSQTRKRIRRLNKPQASGPPRRGPGWEKRPSQKGGSEGERFQAERPPQKKRSAKCAASGNHCRSGRMRHSQLRKTSLYRREGPPSCSGRVTAPPKTASRRPSPTDHHQTICSNQLQNKNDGRRNMLKTGSQIGTPRKHGKKHKKKGSSKTRQGVETLTILNKTTRPHFRGVG